MKTLFTLSFPSCSALSTPEKWLHQATLSHTAGQHDIRNFLNWESWLCKHLEFLWRRAGMCVCLPISHLVCCERAETYGRSPRGLWHASFILILWFYFILYVRLRIVVSLINHGHRFTRTNRKNHDSRSLPTSWPAESVHNLTTAHKFSIPSAHDNALGLNIGYVCSLHDIKVYLTFTDGKVYFLYLNNLIFKYYESIKKRR